MVLNLFHIYVYINSVSIRYTYVVVVMVSFIIANMVGRTWSTVIRIRNKLYIYIHIINISYLLYVYKGAYYLGTFDRKTAFVKINTLVAQLTP